MWRVALSVLILIFDVVAVAGNAIVIVAFIRNKKLRKPSGCYVINLATADFFMAIFGIPFYVATVILNMWPFGDYFCAVWTCFEKVVTLVSNFAIVAICYDRFWLVTKSSDYLSRHSVTKAGVRIGIIWMAAILFRVPFVIFGIYWTWGKQFQLTPCDPRSIYDIPFQVGLYGFDTAYTIFTVLCEFGVPLLLISVWGVQVYMYLKSREKVRLLKAMKVERSRAMSIDFCMGNMDPCTVNNQQTRSLSPAKLCRSTLWSNLRTHDALNKNAKTRSQDTIAGGLFDVAEDPRETNLSHHISHLQSSTSLPQTFSRNELNDTRKSGVNITLNPAETSTADLTSSMDISTISGDASMRTSLSCNDINDTTKSPTPTQSIQSQRRASSLDTLQVPSFSLGHRRRGTNRRTPASSVSLHVPVLDRASKFLPNQCIGEDRKAVTDCSDRSLDDAESAVHSANDTEGKLSAIGNDSTPQDFLRANGCLKKPFICERSLPYSDFLEVPSHPPPKPSFSLEFDEPSETASAGSTESVVAKNQDNRGKPFRKLSFESSVSDIPDSFSSIITVSEPPSPSLKRFSSSFDSVSFGATRGMGLKAKKRYYSYKRRALFTIIFMICVFVVFQLPYLTICTMYSFCYGDCISDELYEAVNWWYWAKIVLNPLLYAYISPEFRRYSLALIKCRRRGKLR